MHWIPPPLPPSLLPPFPTKNLHECCMSRFVVLAGRRHTRAPVVLSWFEIIKSTSVMNINGLWKCRPIKLFSFHVSVVNRETLYVALGVKFGNSTLTCRPGLWRSNLTNDRESPNAGFTRFPSGSRLFRIHCDNLSRISTIYCLFDPNKSTRPLGWVFSWTDWSIQKFKNSEFFMQ